jgi:hypothetical protein
VIDRIRTARRALGACAASLLLAAAFSPGPAPARPAPSGPCAQALAYAKTAASDFASKQARYDSAAVGLGTNAGCNDP